MGKSLLYCYIGQQYYLPVSKQPEYKKRFESWFGRGLFVQGLCILQIGEDIPVPLVKNTVVNTTLALSSFSDVYSFIESDLLKAANYLPKSKSNARIPNQSPVSGSAKAMLAEVYLTMGGYPVLDNNKYLQAAQVAKNVMDSANIYGFNLLPDFANLWDGNHELNNEALFGLYFSNKPPEKIYTGHGNYYYSINQELYNCFNVLAPNDSFSTPIGLVLVIFFITHFLHRTVKMKHFKMFI